MRLFLYRPDHERLAARLEAFPGPDFAVARGGPVDAATALAGGGE